VNERVFLAQPEASQKLSCQQEGLVHPEWQQINLADRLAQDPEWRKEFVSRALWQSRG